MRSNYVINVFVTITNSKPAPKIKEIANNFALLTIYNSLKKFKLFVISLNNIIVITILISVNLITFIPQNFIKNALALA